MAEQSDDSQEIDDPAAASATEAPQEVSDVEKKLRREVARYREQARAALGERDAAVASATQERDIAVAAARDEARSRIVQAELRTQAVRSGIIDLDALKLAELDLVSFNETGEVLGIEEAVSSLRQRKPYLFGADGPVLVRDTTAQTLPVPQPAQPGILDARALSREAWQAERDRLLAGKR